MSRDTRVPVSVTRVGKFIVRIYDMEAYRQAIALYHHIGEPTGSPYKHSQVRSQVKQARFHFADVYTRLQKGETKDAI